jgi:enoyl-CoA hydratase/carnithine racemase
MMGVEASPGGMLTYTTIEFEQRERAACITLNRPDRLNAINDEMIAEINDAYNRVETDPDIWVVIVTGNGRAFCAGADVTKAADHNDVVWAPGIDTQGEPLLSSYRQWGVPQEATPPYLQMTKPIICAINGITGGAGLDLVTTADVTVASDEASFFDPHVSIGLSSGREATRLARVLPLPVAMRMALMGRHERLSVERAYQLGMLTEVVPHGDLMTRAWEIAATMCRNAPLALRATRLSIRKGLSLPIEEAELLAENYRMKVALTADAIEGPKAFLEKRDPIWESR